MSDIRLIATDLDGTLVPFGTKNVPEDLYPVVRELKKKGYIFAPASGRQYASMRKLFAPVADEISYISENGACIFHEGKCIYKQKFEREVALEISYAVLTRSECQMIISGENTSYTTEEDPAFLSRLRDKLGNNVTVIHDPADIKEDLIKIAYFAPAEVIDQSHQIFEASLSHLPMQIMSSGNEWVDFAPLDVGKGQALRAFGQLFGFSTDQMMAFGDNENDRSMLEAVGHPYLMNSCNPTMRDIPASYCDDVVEILKGLL